MGLDQFEVLAPLAHPMQKKDQRPASVGLTRVIPGQKQQVLGALGPSHRTLQALRRLRRGRSSVSHSSLGQGRQSHQRGYNYPGSHKLVVGIGKYNGDFVP